MNKDLLAASIKNIHSAMTSNEQEPEDVFENPLAPRAAQPSSTQPTLSIFNRDELLTQLSKLSLSQLSLIIEVAEEAKDKSKASTLKQYAEMLKEDGVSLEDLAEFMGENFVRLNRPQANDDDDDDEHEEVQAPSQPNSTKSTKNNRGGKRTPLPRPKAAINYIIDNIHDEETTAKDMVSYIQNQLGIPMTSQQIYNLRSQAKKGLLERKK